MEQPKCRTRLHGRSLLDWQLAALRGAGIDEIGLVRGYLAHTFDLPLHYFENERWAQTNMVASLACAADWLQADTCIVSYSDIAYQASTVRRLESCNADVAITYDPRWLDLWSLRFDDPLADAETFRTNDGWLQAIGARASSVEEIEGQFMGLLRLRPAGWAALAAVAVAAPDPDRLDVTALLGRALEQGVQVATVPISETWCEVDSQADLVCYERAPMWRWV